MAMIKRFAQIAVEIIIRPYVWRELRGWGKLYHPLVGKQDRLWVDAGYRTIRGKRHKYLMRLDLSYWPERMAFFLGRWHDLETQLLLEAVVKAGGCVVDVGANRGMFALAAAHAVGPTGRVICFEPNRTCVELLSHEISQNDIKNVDIRACALGTKKAKMILSVPDINHGEATLGRTKYREIEEIECSVEIGDAQLENESPAMIKIDVEGSESSVIQGLMNTIERSRPIISTEVIEEHLNRCGSSQRELYSRMKELNYVGFRMMLNRKHGSWGLKLSQITADDVHFDAVWISNNAVGRVQRYLA